MKDSKHCKNPDQCIQIQLFSGIDFLANDLIRVTFTGDIDKEATEIEATVVGAGALLRVPNIFDQLKSNR